MPPKKESTHKVTQYFSPKGKNTPATTPNKMALTKEDLLTSLKDFKTELREELKTDLAAAIDLLRTDLNAKLQSIQQDLDSVGARTLDLEAKMLDITHATGIVMDGNTTLKEQIETTSLKCEDLENRLRRENIRIRDLEEGAEGPDVEAFITGMFHEILDNPMTKIKIDRVHRVGPPMTAVKRRPRDILVKMRSFKLKEEILKKARQKGDTSFQGFKCALYQDIAPSTLTRRFQLKPVTDKLRQDKIRYRWTYPFGIAFEFNDRSHHATSLEEAAKIMGIDIQTEPHDNMTTTSPWQTQKGGNSKRVEWDRQGRRKGLRPK